MSKRRDSEAQHIRLYRWMTRSAAWRTLPPDAKAVFLHMNERHNGTNNGEIVYGVRCAEEIDVGKNRAARALLDLARRGFIRMRRNASFTGKEKTAREWILTTERYADKPPTKDFMRWPGNSKDCPTSGTIQSHQRDNGAVVENDYRVLVPPAGPTTAKIAPLPSHWRDTSNIPASGERRPPRFGDAARAERTARAPAPRSRPPLTDPLYEDENFGEIAGPSRRW